MVRVERKRLLNLKKRELVKPVQGASRSCDRGSVSHPLPSLPSFASLLIPVDYDQPLQVLVVISEKPDQIGSIWETR